MGFLSFGNNKEKKVAIFDIGSGSVAGAIVDIDILGQKVPSIIKSVRNEIKFREESKFDIFLADMMESFKFTSESLFNSKVGAPEEIFCIFSSPWYVSENRIIKMSRETSFTFTEKIMNELVEKEINTVKEEYKKKYTGIPSEILEHQVMNILLNGYQVEEPIGKTTRAVEINMSVSMSLNLCLDRIRESLSKLYPHARVNFSSFVMDSFIAIRDKYVKQDSYLLIDIGGEVTDLGIVSKGVLKMSLSFPFGKKKFYQIICDKMGIEFRDAEELLKLFSKEALSELKKNELIPILKSIEGKWGEAFRESLKVLPNTINVPETIFLTIDNDIKKWFVDMIDNEEYIKSITIPSKSKVVTLDGPMFLDMCHNIDGPCDPFLMIESIAVMRKLEHRK